VPRQQDGPLMLAAPTLSSKTQQGRHQTYTVKNDQKKQTRLLAT